MAGKKHVIVRMSELYSRQKNQPERKKNEGAESDSKKFNSMESSNERAYKWNYEWNPLSKNVAAVY